MIGLVVQDSYASALIPMGAVSLISLIAFLFRQIARSNEALARTAQQLSDIGRRTERLEGAVFAAAWLRPHEPTERNP